MVAVSYTEFKAQVCGADSTKVNQREYLNNAFKSDFTCPECDKIVIDPQKCNKCETFFCLECAEKIKTGDLPCPVDSEKPFETSGNVTLFLPSNHAIVVRELIYFE